jgi:Spy/CpxP family protein refolding chaperone
MSLIAPGLMQIGSETNFFLLIADQIRLTEEQRATLEELVFEFQKYSVQKLADLNVADAELERLLTRDKIDLDAVRAKVKEIEAINTEVKMRRIESLLKAINTLTHEQHLKIVTLVREIPAPGARPQPERAQE